VCNSIGTISALQAIIDKSDLFNGVFVVFPNFRKLHSAEYPFSASVMLALRVVQRLLRERGQVTFDALAKPATVKQILNKPYDVTSNIDDELVQALLDPLLTDGASNVVFDTLLYSAGALPEEQLGSAVGRTPFLAKKPVWICYGKNDPWTPSGCVEAMVNLPPVEKVQRFPGVGHYPHDEVPELVHPMLMEFLEQLNQNNIQVGQERTAAAS
jgi:pimeloyl-ACP methyl ester carboxylesterase